MKPIKVKKKYLVLFSFTVLIFFYQNFTPNKLGASKNFSSINPTIKITKSNIDLSLTSANENIFFDLVNELKVADDFKSVMAVSKLEDLKSNTALRACKINYRYKSIVETEKLMTGGDFYKLWNQYNWKIAEWGSIFSVCDQESMQQRSTPIDNNLILKHPGIESTNAKSIWFSQDSVLLSLRSVSHFKKMYGPSSSNSAFYRDGSVKNWPALLLNKKFVPDSLANYSAIQFSFKGQMLNLAVNTSDVQHTGVVPKGAQLKYDMNKHGTQLRIFIPVAWEDLSRTAEFKSKCYDSNMNPVSDSMGKPPECFYDGKYFHYGVQLYSEKHEYANPSLTLDKDTKAYMFGTPLNVLDPSLPAQNPFKKVGEVTSINVDILPHFKNAIKDIERVQNEKNFNKADSDKTYYIPPRLTKNGTIESDEDYFKHFRIGSVNIGYEVPGLSEIQFKIYDFKLIGKGK